MGCYQRKDGAFYITSAPRKGDWPRLALRTAASEPARLEQLDALVNDEMLRGGRRDIAMALKQRAFSLDELFAAIGEDLKAVHRLDLQQLGVAHWRALPAPGGGTVITFGEVRDAFLSARGLNPAKVTRRGRIVDGTKDRYAQSFIAWARFAGSGNEEAGLRTPAAWLWDADKLEEFAGIRLNAARKHDPQDPFREIRVVKAASLNRDLTAFSALRQASARRHPQHLGALRTPEFVHEAEGDFIERLLEHDEFEALLVYCDRRALDPAPRSSAIKVRDWEQMKVMLAVLYWTGARLSEMLRMCWRQWELDETAPYVHLEGHASEGDRAERKLDVPEPLRVLMREWRAVAEDRGHPVHRSARVWRGALAGIKAFQKAWRDVRQDVGQEHENVRIHRLHDFRHDAAVAWIKAGASTEDVRVALGHKNRDATYRYIKYQRGLASDIAKRRAAMAATGCQDPMLAICLADIRYAEELVSKLIERHPTLAGRLTKP